MQGSQQENLGGADGQVDPSPQHSVPAHIAPAWFGHGTLPPIGQVAGGAGGAAQSGASPTAASSTDPGGVSNKLLMPMEWLLREKRAPPQKGRAEGRTDRRVGAGADPLRVSTRA